MNRREFFNLIPIPFLSKLIPDKKNKSLSKLKDRDTNCDIIPFSEICANCENLNVYTNLNNGTVNGSFISRKQETNQKIYWYLTRSFELILDYHGEKTRTIVRIDSVDYKWFDYTIEEKKEYFKRYDNDEYTLPSISSIHVKFSGEILNTYF